MRMDLHMHSTFSDGTYTPEMLAKKSRAMGLELICITDHDVASGINRSIEAAFQEGLRTMSGIELSSLHNDDLVHILGYGLEPDSLSLMRTIEHNQNAIADRDHKVLRCLKLAAVDYDSFEYDRSTGGWKLLNYLIATGICSDGYGYLSLLEKLYISLPSFVGAADAIKAIRDSGGISILAHPGYNRDMDANEAKRFLKSIILLGIQGVECFHPYNDDIITSAATDICSIYELSITGGSDWHGNLADRELGEPPLDSGFLDKRMQSIILERK